MRFRLIVACGLVLSLWVGIARAETGDRRESGLSGGARPEIVWTDQTADQTRAQGDAAVIIADLGGSLAPGSEDKDRTPKPSREKKKEKNKPSDQQKDEDEDEDEEGSWWSVLIEVITLGLWESGEEEEVAELSAQGGEESSLLAPLETLNPPIHETFEQPAFQLIGDVSAARLAGGGADLEYDKVGIHAGVWARFAVARFFQTGAGFTYSRAKSDPKFDYRSATEFDVPVSSHIDIFGIAVPFGQTIWESGGSAYFSWGVGPAVYRVEEVTELDFEVLQDGLPTGETGHRKEKQVRYEPGAEIRLGVKGVAGGVIPIGLNGGIAIIHLNPEHQRPMTLDHIEGHTLVRYYAGVSVGYSSRPRQAY